jgi:hypothetical protein
MRQNVKGKTNSHSGYKHLLSLLLVPALFATSCADKYSIEGTSSQNVLDGKIAYIKHMQDSTFVSIDSCKVVHGQFRMSGILDSIMCVSLFMGNDNCIPVVLEHGDITISFANSSVKIEGTPLNNSLYSFLSTRDSLFMQLADLPYRESNMILEGYELLEINRVLAQSEQELRRAIDKLETGFIKDNFDNVLGVTWFLQLCNDAFMHYGYPTTTPQIEEIYGSAPEEFKGHPRIVEYMKLVDEAMMHEE